MSEKDNSVSTCLAHFLILYMHSRKAKSFHFPTPCHTYTCGLIAPNDDHDCSCVPPITASNALRWRKSHLVRCALCGAESRKLILKHTPRKLLKHHWTIVDLTLCETSTKCTCGCQKFLRVSLRLLTSPCCILPAPSWLLPSGTKYIIQNTKSLAFEARRAATPLDPALIGTPKKAVDTVDTCHAECGVHLVQILSDSFMFPWSFWSLKRRILPRIEDLVQLSCSRMRHPEAFSRVRTTVVSALAVLSTSSSSKSSPPMRRLIAGFAAKILAKRGTEAPRASLKRSKTDENGYNSLSIPCQYLSMLPWPLGV